ncbi:MAG TPA: hypothetical protein VFY79_11680 [Dehalococcoidia bacterium]|nr:hypothetical protein [Dehalococcoidia bacterium]
MGDTTNWEFAAVVAAVVMGLSGLLLFSLIATIGSWRIFRLASLAARDASESSLATAELAHELRSRHASEAATPGLLELRKQAEGLLGQQERLHEATRKLVESRAIGGDGGRLAELEASMRRLEEQLNRIAENIAHSGGTRST